MGVAPPSISPTSRIDDQDLVVVPHDEDVAYERYIPIHSIRGTFEGQAACLTNGRRLRRWEDVVMNKYPLACVAAKFYQAERILQMITDNSPSFVSTIQKDDTPQRLSNRNDTKAHR